MLVHIESGVTLVPGAAGGHGGGNVTNLRLILVAIAVRQPRTRRSHKINMSREVRPYIWRVSF